MKLSRFHRNMGHTCIEQSQRQFRLPKPAVETITELIQIFLKIPGRTPMKRAVQKLFHVAAGMNRSVIRLLPTPFSTGWRTTFVKKLNGDSMRKKKANLT
jgi:hypothetical protein